MKKTIKAELVSLTHKILQLREGSDYENMAEKARELYEKLTVLAYAEKLEKAGNPTIGLKEIENSLEDVIAKEVVETPVAIIKVLEDSVTKASRTPAEILAENQSLFPQARNDDRHRPDGTQFSQEEPMHEPVIEKIKDMVAEMPPEAAEIDEIIESIEPRSSLQKNDMFDIGGEYAQTPIFDPVETVIEEETPKKLNDKLKSGLKIGLNDRITFVKHLFNGSTEDYNRVLSQLSTFQTKEEAKQFVADMIKPDYNNWKGKELQEEKFLDIIDSKFGK
ncbi:MAG: hypothetical protein ACI828_000029 [Flavobacteriales bacterium]|jgi:hypothetical protein